MNSASNFRYANSLLLSIGGLTEITLLEGEDWELTVVKAGFSTRGMVDP